MNSPWLIDTQAVDKIKDRLPPLESQVALHSEVWEKLQVGIHYVLRHYVRVLEGLCMKELFILKHRR